jgi:hypothetical protein
MYDDLSTSTRLDVTSQTPYQLGKWQHVVVVYDPVLVSNATLTIYIDGVQANQATWNGGASGTAPGYGPCTDTHDAINAPNGQPAMALGGYNNSNPGGNYGDANPWIGGIDEFAWYPAKLTPTQIQAHYQNGTNPNRAQSYSSLILSHNPRAYLRLDEIAPGQDVAVNYGDLRGSSTATNTAEVRHPAPSALKSGNGGAASYHLRNGSATSDIPWLGQNNPDSSVPFTFETWLRPTNDRQNPGAAPVNNRYVNSGHRTGWVIFQRAPNASYSTVSGYSGVGWNFRMYDGVTGSGQDVTTSVDYNIGEWQHFVVTWEPQTDNGDPGANGNHQYLGVLTAYFNGVAVASNTAALYAANTNPTEDATAPADLAVGSYNIASGLGSNPFEGDIAHLAIYTNYVLTPAQILAHYQAGTNANPATNYEALVFRAAGDLYLANGGTVIPERITLPVTYLSFNDPARYPAANSGTVGIAGDGNLDLTANTVAGPQPPGYPGFDLSNLALPLDGLKQWASLNNPSGLNFSGQITLEAWVKPAAVQGAVARIISHGPQTASSYLGQGKTGSITNTSEVFLRIDGSGANYSVGSAKYDDSTSTTNTYGASYAVPAGDLGGASWVYLAGTYDGANWKLYRNAVLVATQASATGALPVDLGDWAIGSTGNGWADPFAGNIDEPAIYNKALTPAQIAYHYVMGNAGTIALTVARAGGGNVTITWPAGTTLQQATAATGPYVDVPGPPTSPATIAASGVKFYRWRLQVVP